MRKFLIPLCLTLLLSCCNNKKETIPVITKTAFTSFELSYYSGFERHFDIRIDSNKIFFSPSSWNVVSYGIIPDSLFTVINTTIATIINNKSIVNKKATCEDCPVVAIRLFAGKDSIRIRQDGQEIDEAFLKMTRPLYIFLSRYRNDKAYRTMYLETREMIKEQPPAFPE